MKKRYIVWSKKIWELTGEEYNELLQIKAEFDDADTKAIDDLHWYDLAYTCYNRFYNYLEWITNSRKPLPGTNFDMHRYDTHLKHISDKDLPF